MNDFLSGAIFMGYLICAVFFRRAFHQTSDVLFARFGWAFAILALERLVLVAFPYLREQLPAVYLARLFAFLVIAWAILAKNASSREP